MCKLLTLAFLCASSKHFFLWSSLTASLCVFKNNNIKGNNTFCTKLTSNSLPGPLPASQNAQLAFPCTRQIHSKYHKTVIDKTAETRDLTWRPAVCLSVPVLLVLSLPPSFFLLLPLCSNKYSILTVGELCRYPWVCRAFQSSSCLLSARNNRRGSLFWTD